MGVLKVLVVDDEPGIRSGVARILGNFHVTYPFMDEDYTFDVMQAASGEESIEMVEKDKPDIILLDNKLPGMQGVEVLEYIRPEIFEKLKKIGLDLGFRHVESGPLVRSSYHAEKHIK